MIASLWKMMQSDSFYKDNTTFFIVPDHGRGIGDEWTDHSSNVPHSNETWFMALGPDTKPLGEIKTKEQIFQTQYAKTIAAFLGVDYKLNDHTVGETIESVMDK